ncbi:MAG: hypothetical protein ACEPOV_04150 [Hyphomicrobiales bacterium]
MKRFLFIYILLALSNVAFSQDWQKTFYWKSGEDVRLNGDGSKVVDYTFDFLDYSGLDRWSIWSNGDVFTVRNNGRVGILTSDPAKGFHVKTETLFGQDIVWDPRVDYSLFCDKPTIGATFIFDFRRNDKGDAIVYKSEAHNNILTINSNGNVGVKTSDPSANWHVNGSSIINKTVLVFGETEVKSMNFGESSVFTSDDKLGLGTLAPEKPIHVVGNAKIRGNVVAERILLDISSFPDYVFESGYKLKPLNEVSDFINKNGHLPGLPKAEEVVQTGIDVAQMNILLMEKVEELTLHAIEHEKKIGCIKDKYLKAFKELKDLQSKMEEK